ncbi:glycosyltransferase family 4 protein [Selenomonas sp.]|uniref:glycosyltransferase family 4 protein n=1 Tax=Selenomonas sp. TaxID=2053611 RepID=UPI0025EEA624|nr:glycosyltransferase family 4 protein [Selenomonas sp.]MCI6284979.1 glycosyltransferase family 4 protein [Selenomonas sp.]
MRVAIVTVQVPFVRGGAEVLAETLRDELRKRHHEAEIVTIPFAWYPWTSLIKSMHMGRMMDLSYIEGRPVDKVIALKFPAYYVNHNKKVYWLLHQHRQAYDLWGTPYSDIEQWGNGEKIREFIRTCDKKYIGDGKKVYTIARNVSKRLKKYCQIDSTPLYHPPQNYEVLHADSYGDYVFYPSRINVLKRQGLLVRAASYLKTQAKIVISGNGPDSEVQALKKQIEDVDVKDRVKFTGFISNQEKIDYYRNCLAVYYGTYDEDYGYITLEGLFSEKPVIVHTDAGGPLEFINDGENGFVVDPEPQEIARKIDYLYTHRKETEKMGKNGRQSLVDKNVNWDYVIDRLLN